MENTEGSSTSNHPDHTHTNKSCEDLRMDSSSSAPQHPAVTSSPASHSGSDSTGNKDSSASTAAARMMMRRNKQHKSRVTTFGSTASSSARSMGNHHASSRTAIRSAGACCCPNQNRAGTRSNHRNQAVWTSRVVFFTFLIAVAAVMGFLAFFLLTQQETSLAETQFASVAERALHSAVAITQRKRLGGVSLATVASFAAPDASEWPLVSVTGFSKIATKMLDTSSGDDTGFVPFVKPDELAEFEEFAFHYYEKERRPPFPNGTAMSSFGKAVWEPDLTGECETPDRKCRVTDGSVPYDSPNDIIAPILHHSLGAHPILMVNTRYEAGRGTLIDNMIACAEQRRNAESIQEHVCDGLADIFFVPDGHFGQPLQGPLSVIMHPIFPANDETELTGFIGSSIVWEDVLQNGFNSEVNGIDCVLESDTQQYTYSVSGGVPSFKGQEDLHDPNYNRYRVVISLTGEGLFSDSSVSISLSLYPNREFFETYSTSNPRLACVGSILLVLCVSVCFVLYDYFVRQEFLAQQELLHAKRAFMRFISHEVRTPLNSCCTGLTLLQEEIETTLESMRDGEEDDKQPAIVSKGGGGSKDVAAEKSTNKKSSPAAEVAANADKVANWQQLTIDIHSSALSAVAVLNDILNWDKVDNGQMQLELSVIPIWTLINRTIHEFDVPAKTKSLNLIVQFSPEEVDPETGEPSPTDHKLIGDKVRIVQCIRNLTSNALKFTPAGGSLTVNARLREFSSDDGPEQNTEGKEFKLHEGEVIVCQPDGCLELVMSDTGAGMTPDQLELLFKAGVQFNANEFQNGGGSGLGLCITKGIVEQHGGTLEASSEGLGKGATFTMTLPLYKVPQRDGFAEPEAVPAERLSLVPRQVEQFLPLRLLVVDDAALNRKLVVRLLEKHGHICDQACDGQEAVDMVKKATDESNPYHSILCDYEMPNKDGPTAVAEMREYGCDSFIVGITGNLLLEDVNYFKSCGANGVLPKPFQMSELEMMWVEYGVVGITAAA